MYAWEIALSILINHNLGVLGYLLTIDVNIKYQKSSVYMNLWKAITVNLSAKYIILFSHKQVAFTQQKIGKKWHGDENTEENGLQ